MTSRLFGLIGLLGTFLALQVIYMIGLRAMKKERRQKAEQEG